MDTNVKRAGRRRRAARIAKQIRGTADRPRLSVYRSNSAIYAQVIDDDRGHTLVAASSLEPQAGDADAGSKSDVARRVGEVVGERARQAGITRVVLDRGGFRYAGRVKALADGAREAGLDF
ncbi:MAG: 50S ribosomal protein L18 [Actinobacteria bacterium]|nr:50S ribosomal protein L18 [Actinomycetota bacterium]